MIVFLASGKGGEAMPQNHPKSTAVIQNDRIHGQNYNLVFVQSIITIIMCNIKEENSCLCRCCNDELATCRSTSMTDRSMVFRDPTR